jgi:predicted flap endonuclease-1-like 5' DNA nuclease
MFWILIALLIFGLSALLGWAIVYIRYCRTPEKRWCNGVLRLMAEARRREQKEKDRIRDLDASREEEKKSLQGKEFSAYLGSISTSELELFSGIGPATVARLHEAGYANLASLQHADVHVHGLGEKRLDDIAKAVQELTKQAWGRFEAGGCPEAQTLKPKFDALRSKYDNLKFVTQARLKGAEAVVEKLEHLLPIVRQVTFFNYWRKTWSNIVPADIFEAPLPDLEGTIQKAEEIATSFHRLNELLSTGEQSSVFQLAERIIQDSGPLSDGTNDFLATIAKKLGVPFTDKPIGNETKTTPARSEMVSKSRQEGKNQLSTDQCRGILEIAPTVPLSPDLVRRQYHLLHEKYNPEKVVSLGPEFVEMTEKKRQDISIAANALIEQLGEKLELHTAEPSPKSLRENPDLDAAFGA